MLKLSQNRSERSLRVLWGQLAPRHWSFKIYTFAIIYLGPPPRVSLPCFEQKIVAWRWRVRALGSGCRTSLNDVRLFQRAGKSVQELLFFLVRVARRSSLSLWLQPDGGRPAATSVGTRTEFDHLAFAVVLALALALALTQSPSSASSISCCLSV